MKRKLPLLQVIGIFSIAILFLFFFLELKSYLSSSFNIKEVQIDIRSVEKEDALRLKLETFLSQLKGENMFLLDIHRLQKTLLEFSEIWKVKVFRKFPHSIKVEIFLETPFAIVHGEKLSFINEKAVPYREVQSGDMLSYPLISIENGEHVQDLPPGRIKAAVQLLQYIKDSSVLEEENIEEIFLRSSDYLGMAPIELILRLPPMSVTHSVKSFLLTVVRMEERNLAKQTRRLELLIKRLLEQGKTFSLARMELGKKVVVKIAQ